MNYLINNPLTFVAAVFALAVVVLAWLITDTRKKWNRIFGKKAETNSETIAEAMRRLLKVEEQIEALKPRVGVLEGIGKVAVQKVGFMRFNPFEHTGGDQSFAVALLDRENNGVVISSLYTREGVRVYAKKVQGGVPRQQLSQEEEKVLREAMGS